MPIYSFDEIAFNSTEKKKPCESDKSTYLGLEHLDSGCLFVRRFGSETAPIGEKLVMKKGDVLFGKRRAYQKKVAIAPFDGIFSAHGMVLRPKEKVVDKRFFPMFISSDYFLDAAIKISVGSLSPTINWNALKRLKFNLPPLEEQRKLADLLWSAYELKESYKRLLAASDEMAKSRFVEMFGGEKYPKQTIESICTIVTDGTHQPPRFVNEGIPFLFVSNIVDNELTYETSKYISQDTYKELIKRTPIEIGDVLLSIVGSYGNPAIVRTPKAFCFQRHLAYLKPNRCKVSSEYLHAAFLTPNVKAQIERKVKGIAQKTLNLSELKSVIIPLPPLALQNEFAAFVEQLDKSKVALQKSIDNIDTLVKSLLNTINSENTK